LNPARRHGEGCGAVLHRVKGGGRMFERLRQWLILWPDVAEKPRRGRKAVVDKPRRVRLLPKRLERVRTR
jgi:hypothetical protein